MVLTRNQLRRIKEQKVGDEQPLSELMHIESIWTSGQNICNARDMNFRKIHAEMMSEGRDMTDFYRFIFDLSCELIKTGMVKRNDNGEYQMYQEDADIYDWGFAIERVNDNCKFVKELGHSWF